MTSTRAPIMDEDVTTDVTIEIFNHCEGTCTGCLLSVAERRSAMPVMTLSRFKDATAAVKQWSIDSGRFYRCLLTFGDIPWLPLKTQENYYQAITDQGLSIGLTMTMVEQDKFTHYREALDLVTQADPGVVFDITLDPIRMERQPDYVERLLVAMDYAPHLHLQVLLSEAVIQHYAPEELSDSIAAKIGKRPILLGFTPSLENLERKNYRYQVSSAADYARRFYSHTKTGRNHLARELARYDSVGDHADFIGQTFHIGPDLNVYPIACTVWGDVILDSRNGGQPLGKIGADQPLREILTGIGAKRQSIKSTSWMSRGDFDCDDCTYRSSCEFNGIGAARRLYRDFESRTGSCYGPREVDSVIAPQVAAE
ncbi:MAG: hypothetical protein CL558_04135 [Alphaproteobacteria bacterium]|nr:hypothetical protein [Alphaproteobacteria bacterium]MAS48862.1 hypothetical protein [Alphaproteobacteria bacterium]MBN52750.1 hypothetical protein [Alphaproteobacteria bacterium]OUT39478.1 MAG: hypothetical protein CBB62_13980 [Micavibrio sp. TMED2]|tara:strand:- start:5503 stop:6609 length:1107 start_codon:yes stop_codon:yes gene_type:complete